MAWVGPFPTDSAKPTRDTCSQPDRSFPRVLKTTALAAAVNQGIQQPVGGDPNRPTSAYVDYVPNSAELALELNDPAYYFTIYPDRQYIGASSLLGLWDQWGPKILDHDQPNTISFKDNPNKPTKSMSHIDGSEKAANDVSDFLDAIILKHGFDIGNGEAISLQESPLHIAGESYAGHYIPAIGVTLVKSGKAQNLKLQSLFCGNRMFDMQLIGPGIWDLLCPKVPSLKLDLTDQLKGR
ncbi:hypothetical protein LTS15_010379 [Exophiala xenobiotica]|nr:hypothetical protein LTS15_010379 [Exophiala xenobiotica]